MSDPVPSSAIYDATTGGLSVIVVTGGSTGDVLTLQSDGTYAAATPTTGGIGGSVGSTTNRLVKSSGTGGSTVQASGITVDASNNVSGVGTLACSQILGSGTGYSVGVFGASADISSGYRNLDINAPSGLPTLQFKQAGVLKSQHYWDGTAFDIYSAGHHALLSASSTQMLGFGGLMVGTPALKRVANTLQVRLGNDSNFAGLSCGDLTANAAFNLAPITKAALLLLTPTAASAGRWRVTDATPASREAYPDGTNWRYTSDDTVVT